MNAWPTILAGLALGAILGSFLATLCLRWPAGLSVATGRSRCDGCGEPVPGRRLVPLLSAAMAGGQARCCGTRIDPLHWQVEAAAALIGAGALTLSPTPAGWALAAFGWLLLPLLILDRRHFWLPDRLTLALAIGGLALGGLLSGASLSERLLTAAVAGGGLALVGLAYRLLRGREGLGGGDPKLFGALGLWLGAQPTAATLLAAALIGLGEAILRRSARGDAQPLGAYLCLAAWLVAAVGVARA